MRDKLIDLLETINKSISTTESLREKIAFKLKVNSKLSNLSNNKIKEKQIKKFISQLDYQNGYLLALNVMKIYIEKILNEDYIEDKEIDN